ncbi:MAG: hypothetical protein RI897_3981 [Verrucomicrobiota bacterium]
MKADSSPKTKITRRSFLQSTALTSTTSLLILPSKTVFGSAANAKIQLGLIGCGGRGQWIANLFAQDGQYTFTAGADYFQDRVDAFSTTHNVPPARRFTGLSGYQRLLDSKSVDAVVIETPPYFHPRQANDSVAAGKHVFLAKPIAVDAPGCLTIADADKQATANNLVFLVDFQTRASSHYREAFRMLRNGDIGPLVMVEAHYPWRGGGRNTPPTSPEEQLRSWYHVRAISGDFIVEQSIHALDVATWITNTNPIAAAGTGGFKVRPEGSIFDHFALHYRFPNDLTLAFTCIQSIPEVKDQIIARAYGADGVLETDYYTGVLLKGKEAYRGDEPNLYTTGAQTNIREFGEHIRNGNYTNPTVAPSVRSNLTAVLGREAAYHQTYLTLEDLIAKAETLEPNLQGLKT